MSLSFRQKIITRGGNEVRLYHIYDTYIHGAYESGGHWYIANWTFDGHFLPLEQGKQHITSVDLINDDPEWSIPEINPRIKA